MTPRLQFAFHLDWGNIRLCFWKAFNILLIIVLVVVIISQLFDYVVQRLKCFFAFTVLTGDSTFDVNLHSD